MRGGVVAIGSLVESDASYFSFLRSAGATQDLDALRRDLTSKIRDAERLHGIPTQSAGTSRSQSPPDRPIESILPAQHPHQP